MTKLKWPLNPAYQLAICATLPTPPPKWCSHIFCFPLKPPTSFLFLLLADDLASHFTRKIKSISKVYPQAPTAETHLFAPVPMSSTSLPVTKDELSVLLSNPLPAHTHAPTHTHIHTLDSIPSHLYMAITSTIPPSLMDHFHQHTNTSYNFSILKRSRDFTSLSRVILFLYCPLRNISLDSLVPSPLLPFPLEFHLFPKTPLTKVTLHSQVDLGSPLTPSQSFPPP